VSDAHDAGACEVKGDDEISAASRRISGAHLPEPTAVIDTWPPRFFVSNRIPRGRPYHSAIPLLIFGDELIPHSSREVNLTIHVAGLVRVSSVIGA
jgi:hypothetical protein